MKSDNVVLKFIWKRPRTSKTTLKKDKVEGFTVTSRNGNPLQYSCLENPMDTGAWGAIVHGVTKESDTTW